MIGAIAKNIIVYAAALTFLVAATPVTWVGLIIYGLVVAGVTAAASMKIDTQLKKHGGTVYDNIMSSVGSL